MPSTVLRRMDMAAKKAERQDRAISRKAKQEARKQQRRRRRNLDVVGRTVGLDYQLVDQLIQPEEFPEDLTDEIKKKLFKKAGRQAGNFVKKAMIAEVKAEELDSRKTGTRELWSESQRTYHEDVLGRKHLVQSFKVKVIDDKENDRLVVLVGPDSKENAWYAWFLEFGWMNEYWGTGTVEAQRPRYFMRKAVNKSQGGASKIFVDKVKEFMRV